MWWLDFLIKGIIFWFIIKALISPTKKLLNFVNKIHTIQYANNKYVGLDNIELDNKTNDKSISGNYIHKNNKYAEYDIEKVYAIKFNHISKYQPDKNNLSDGYIWLNTKNNTLNIYYNGIFHEYPILCKSIIKQYMKRPIKS